MTAGASPDALPPVPAQAEELFGSQLRLAQRYVASLASDGIDRGLLGPREVSRLWSRHVLNSAVLTELVPPGARVVDVGSGAGLPGIPMAIRRPELRVTLVEPMLRRSTYLDEVVNLLDLGERVDVCRGRADDDVVRRHVGEADVVVARAVARLDRLVEWCLPMVRVGGRLLALKGASAAVEVTEFGPWITATTGAAPVVHELTVGADVTWVVEVARHASVNRKKRGHRG